MRRLFVCSIWTRRLLERVLLSRFEPEPESEALDSLEISESVSEHDIPSVLSSSLEAEP